jgi:hypothetical protein
MGKWLKFNEKSVQILTEYLCSTVDVLVVITSVPEYNAKIHKNDCIGSSCLCGSMKSPVRISAPEAEAQVIYITTYNLQYSKLF